MLGTGDRFDQFQDAPERRAGDQGAQAIFAPSDIPVYWQLIQFALGDDVYQRHRTLTEPTEVTMEPFIKAGRAALTVVLAGFLERERPPDFITPIRKGS